MVEREKDVIEALAEEAERSLEVDYEKRDLKARRAMAKDHLYDGSKKLKHQVPKGWRA